MSDFIELGDVARDRVTGFEGVVIANTQWLNGCDRLSLQPRKLVKGKPVDTMVFDRPQLERVSQQVLKASRKTGGPQANPERHEDPSR